MIKQSGILRGTNFTDLYFASSPEPGGDLESQTERMFSQLGDNAKYIQYERIFVANPEDLEPVFEFRQRFYQKLGVEAPATSYIVVPPCNGAKVGMVAIGVRPELGNKLEAETLGGEFYNRARIVDYDGFRQIYFGNVAGIRGGVPTKGFVDQLWEAMLSIHNRLEQNGFDFKRDMLRTWFSITDINKARTDKRTNYMDFNEHVREKFLKELLGYEDRYFASTGVGNGVNLDGRFAEASAIAYQQNGEFEVNFMDNRLQSHTKDYVGGDKPDDEKKNVCFERGMQVITPTVVQYFVSGTASIRNKQVVGKTLAQQTHVTAQNIMVMLSDYDAGFFDTMMAVTYVKPGQDASVVEKILTEYKIGPKQIPHLIVFNELCYRSLLVETELFAAVPLKEYMRRKANTT